MMPAMPEDTALSTTLGLTTAVYGLPVQKIVSLSCFKIPQLYALKLMVQLQLESSRTWNPEHQNQEETPRRKTTKEVNTDRLVAKTNVEAVVHVDRDIRRNIINKEDITGMRT